MQMRTERLFRITLAEREATEVRETLVAGIEAQGTEDADASAVQLAAALTASLGIEIAPDPDTPSLRIRRRAEARTGGK